MYIAVQKTTLAKKTGWQWLKHNLPASNNVTEGEIFKELHSL